MFISAENLTQSFPTAGGQVYALRSVSFGIEEGEVVVILGSSGAGKSSLLNLLGGMESPASGKLFVDGRDIAALSPKQLTAYRRKEVGFVFQFYNLLPNLTAYENIRLAAELARTGNAAEALSAVGLTHRRSSFPAQLSGGEQQRIAIARALVKDPKLILCDEPTGALDSATGKSVMELLFRVQSERRKTLVIVTHNAELARCADRVIVLHDGEIVENRLQSRVSVEEIAW